MVDSPAGAGMERQLEDGSAPRRSRDANVRVYVRVRPLVPAELVAQASVCVHTDTVRCSVVVGKDREFCFDGVLDITGTQRDVYDACVARLVEGAFEGYNACVFAYGQTGSGKTYTMGSDPALCAVAVDTSSRAVAAQGGSGLDDSGIIPRVISSVFDRVERPEHDVAVVVRASFMEIYREELHDLLYPETQPRSISIRESPDGGIVVAGIRERVVSSMTDLFELLQLGAVCRTTGSTRMNERSSRSHAIFTIYLEQRRVSPGRRQVVSAKFHLVDLAGSERNKRTGAVGVRFKESITINEGLLALGNVISALSDERKRARGGHVPYRDSKLTRLLQDSLGGNSRTTMIACVSPADNSFEESLNTLKYAARARNIRNRPVVNVAVQGPSIVALQSEIAVLQSELTRYRAEPLSPAGVSTTTTTRDAEAKLAEFAAEVENLKAALTAADTDAVAFAENLFSVHAQLVGCKRLMERAKERLLQVAVADDSLSRARLKEACRAVAGSLVPPLPSAFASDMSEWDRPVTAPPVTASALHGLPEEEEVLSAARAAGMATSVDTGLARREQRPIEAATTTAPPPVGDGLHEIAALQRALAEARSDLARDEEIFASKLALIADLQQRLQQLHDDNGVLKEALAEAERDAAAARAVLVAPPSSSWDASESRNALRELDVARQEISTLQKLMRDVEHERKVAEGEIEAAVERRVKEALLRRSDDHRTLFVSEPDDEALESRWQWLVENVAVCANVRTEEVRLSRIRHRRDEIVGEREELVAQREELAARVAERVGVNVDDGGPANNGPDVVAALRDVDDALDVLQAELEYNEDTMARSALAGAPEGVEGASPRSLHDLLLALSNAPPGEAKVLLQRCVEALVALNEELRRRDDDDASVRLQLQESNYRIVELEAGLRRAEMEFQRRLEQRARRQDAKVGELTQQLTDVSGSVSALQQENEFFRNANRQLKRQLRAITERAVAGDGGDDPDADAVAARQLRLENHRLQTELANLKAYFQRHYGTDAFREVRLSKHDLREVQLSDIPAA